MNLCVSVSHDFICSYVCSEWNWFLFDSGMESCPLILRLFLSLSLLLVLVSFSRCYFVVCVSTALSVHWLCMSMVARHSLSPSWFLCLLFVWHEYTPLSWFSVKATSLGICLDIPWGMTWKERRTEVGWGKPAYNSHESSQEDKSKSDSQDDPEWDTQIHSFLCFSLFSFLSSLFLLSCSSHCNIMWKQASNLLIFWHKSLDWLNFSLLLFLWTLQAFIPFVFFSFQIFWEEELKQTRKVGHDFQEKRCKEQVKGEMMWIYLGLSDTLLFSWLPLIQVSLMFSAETDCSIDPSCLLSLHLTHKWLCATTSGSGLHNPERQTKKKAMRNIMPVIHAHFPLSDMDVFTC